MFHGGSQSDSHLFGYMIGGPPARLARVWQEARCSTSARNPSTSFSPTVMPPPGPEQPVEPDFAGFDVPVEISPAELKRLLDQEQPLELVDCREAEEFALGEIAGARSLPTSAIRDWLPKFACPAGQPLVVYCHHGIRSFHVVAALRASGIRHARSLAGGIEAWSTTVDPSVPRY